MPLVDYTDLATMKVYLNLGGTTSYDDLLSAAISSASREVDRYTNRYFGREDTASERTFDAHGNGVVWIDDMWTDDGFSSSVSGTLYPYDNFLNGESGWPYDRLRSDAISSGDTITVTGKWGWEEVPSTVAEATKLIAANTFMQKDVPLGVKSFDDMGSVYIRVPHHIMKKLDLYTKHRVMVF